MTDENIIKKRSYIEDGQRGNNLFFFARRR